jgi:anti-sigma factor RsiW
MGTCSELAPKILALLDGELPSGETGTVESHLAACAPCAELRARHERVTGLLRNAPVAVPSAGEWSRILERAREPLVHWRKVAVAAMLAIALPGIISLVLSSSPLQRDGKCSCDMIAPAFDVGL